MTASVTVGRWRAWLVAGSLGLCGLALVVRLVELQGVRHGEFLQQVLRQRIATEVIPARPGEILDRHGRILATTVTSRSLYLVPAVIENSWEVASRVAEALEIDPDQLYEKLAAHPTRQFLWVKRRLTPAEVDRIRALDLPSAVFGFRDEYLRRYPQGNLAAQVLGLRDIDGQGRGGLEQQFHQELSGQPGQREVVRDARGHIIDVAQVPVREPIAGQTLTVTLDVVVQLFAEQALDDVMREFKPQACCAIVMAAKTGEILGMASRPTFDPNQSQKIPDAAWRNRPVTDIYEPGSTFKPFVVAWALQQGLIRNDEVFDCENGEYWMGKRLLHDHHRYGRLNVTDILVKSSNIGMAKIGERLGNEGLYTAAVRFGFGRPTGIELPGELSGTVHPLAKWTSYSTGSVPMGQEISTTPLQIITAFSALANRGKYITPRIVLSRGASPSTPPIHSAAVGPEPARWITQSALTEVVKRGTGRRAQVKTYEIFGKTGTAQKLDLVRGGYSADKNLSSFVCGGPAHDPEVLVMLVVDEPSGGGDGHGGTVAAPAAALLLEQTLLQLRVPTSQSSLRSVLEPRRSRKR